MRFVPEETPKAAEDAGGKPGGEGQARAESDAEALSRLGYAQELLRSMGGFSSFALSFSIISVMTGIVTTYDVAITGGGPASLGWGWPVVCAGTLLVALSMAELASAFPTAGAMYHWSSLLGGPAWGWFTAAMNLVGQVAIVSAIDLGCAQQCAAALELPAWGVYGLFALVVLQHGLLNLVSVKAVAWLNDLSASVHLLGVCIFVGLLWTLRSHPVPYAFETGFTTRTDGDYTFGFVGSLLLGMWTFTGFDASAHVSEETRDPARRAPWGILSSVVVSAVAGYALVIALTLAIHDLPATAADPHPALFILRGALGAGWGRAAMSLAVVAMWFCGLSAVTSLSRATYAFARDGGLPGSSRLREVGARYRTPHFAVLLASLLPLGLGLSSALLTDDQFLGVASLATTSLYVSYALPVGLGARARHKGTWRRFGPFRLGWFGPWIAWSAVAWSLFVLATAAIPHGGAYVALLAGVGAGLGAIYLLFLRHRFAGPPRPAWFEGDGELEVERNPHPGPLPRAGEGGITRGKSSTPLPPGEGLG
jgi:amino acid transporter